VTHDGRTDDEPRQRADLQAYSLEVGPKITYKFKKIE